MKGDFSRIRFDRANQYAAVVRQQGRVDLDSDDIEQHAIDLTLRQTINTDVIGQYGGPENDAGFAISIEGNQILIGPGRYYVQGIEVENPQTVSYDAQPYLMDPTSTASGLLAQLQQAGVGATLGFVLQVWRRLVTALDDPSLLEPALGEADTTVRLQTVWRVIGVLNPSDEKSGGEASNPISRLTPSCQVLYALGPDNARTGTMSAALAQAGSECGCQPIAAAEYQGLENQLYRVEIHQGGDLTTATFKWSRENGSVVAAVTDVNGPIVTSTTLGPDANFGFQAGQWVELSDDTNLFGENPNQSGILCQIQSVNPATLQVTMTAPVGASVDPTRNARMRRWDQTGASASPSGIQVSGPPIALENGITVSFGDGQYQPGDYWTIPARTANGQIDWPIGDGTGAVQPPSWGSGGGYRLASYMQVYRAPIACIRRIFIPIGPIRPGHVPVPELFIHSRFVVDDCRLLFPPLNALNASATPPALHVSAITWKNDDVMTVDTFLEQGLSITFDQAPTCPWGGGNFQVTLQPPVAADTTRTYDTVMNAIGVVQAATGTDVFLRTMFALDPPRGVTSTGSEVIWLPPLASQNREAAVALWRGLNVLLGVTSPVGYARMMVRLDGAAVYGAGSAGNIYLDGQAFGATGTRASDGSSCVSLTLPSGNGESASDFEGWFYLAPSALIQSVVIQGVVGGATQTITDITMTINSQGTVLGLTTNGSTVSQVQAVVTLTYPPVADTVVTLSFFGAGSTVVTIPATATVPAGQITSAPVPITFQGNPPTATPTNPPAPYVVTLNGTVATAFQSISILGKAPTLNITVVVETIIFSPLERLSSVSPTVRPSPPRQPRTRR